MVCHQTQHFEGNATCICNCDANLNWQIIHLKLFTKDFYRKAEQSKQRKSESEQREWGIWTNGRKAGKDRSKLTPHVVMTGSLKTLQHSWQHSFTDGCSANTWGSCTKTHTLIMFICSVCGVVSVPKLYCHCSFICLSVCEHTFMFPET